MWLIFNIHQQSQTWSRVIMLQKKTCILQLQCFGTMLVRFKIYLSFIRKRKETSQIVLGTFGILSSINIREYSHVMFSPPPPPCQHLPWRLDSVFYSHIHCPQHHPPHTPEGKNYHVISNRSTKIKHEWSHGLEWTRQFV